MSLSESIDRFFLSSKVALEGALNNSEIQNYLLEFAYTPERIERGKALYDLAWEALMAQPIPGERDMSIVEEALAVAQPSYDMHLRIARVAFRKDGVTHVKLGLMGDRKPSLSGWLMQAKQFYSQSLDDLIIVDVLADYGLSQERLEAGKVKVEAVDKAYASYQDGIEAAIQHRDDAIDGLADWIADFLAIAILAIGDRPELLPVLGIDNP